MIMKSGLGILMIAAATLAGAATSSHAQSPAQYGQGAAPGMMGQGMGPGMMGQGMGPGMMGQGLAPGVMGQGMGPMMGPCPYGQGMMGPGMMGQGMGPGMMGHGMGPGMMGQGMGPGMMGQGMGPGVMGQGMAPGMMGQGMGPGPMMALPQDLSVENVRHMLEHRLAWQGNPNLKLGEVEEKDEDTIEAEIVTQDGSLVQRLEVDRHTGWMRPAA